MFLYFMGIMLILWPLQFISARSMAKKNKFDAIVEFNEDEIIIDHQNKEEIETTDWRWIRSIDLRPDRVWLVINQRPSFGVSIPNEALKESEIAFFERMRTIRGKG